MSNYERPGVYTSYEASGGLRGGSGGGAVGLAAAASGGKAGEVKLLTSYAEAVSAFGGGNMVALVKLLLENGAPEVYACAVTDSDYDTAFSALMGAAAVRYMVCDSRSAAVHAKLSAAIAGADEQSKYRIGIVESGETARDKLVSAAAALNSERMVLVSHHETDGVSGAVAAAVCGAVAGESDPAVPLGGAALSGLGEIGGNFSDSDLELLLRGGVTALETVGGAVSVVRGVTSRTKTAGAADDTWHDLGTILIVDEVIPGIRDALRAGFARAKNTAQTRGAIRTRVVIELESYQQREIIDGYSDVRAEADESDGSICAVSFCFGVAHGLSRVELKANITI